MKIVVQEADFSLEAETRTLCAGRAHVGAVVSFVGVVRDLAEHATLSHMCLEHYPGMTEKALTAIAQEAAARWPIEALTLIHRVGTLQAGEQIVLVAVATRHRHAAFQACEFVMDYLKTQAPFWKKEYGPEGAVWVDARESDDQALARWGAVSTHANNAESCR